MGNKTFSYYRLLFHSVISHEVIIFYKNLLKSILIKKLSYFLFSYEDYEIIKNEDYREIIGAI